MTTSTAFVLRKPDGTFVTGSSGNSRYSKGGPFDKARLFRRRCDAAQCGGTGEIVPVVVTVSSPEDAV